MRLVTLVETSNAVRAAAGRLDKIGRLAALLKQADHKEISTVVGALSGLASTETLGVGYAVVAAASDVVPAAEPTLTLQDLESTLATVAEASGKGAVGMKTEALRSLFSRATLAEQDFLRRLLFGELRQGALEGVLIEAVARAADLPAARIRRATMVAGDLASVAHVALQDGAALDALGVELMRPVKPMLAASGESVDEAIARFGDASLEYKLDGARVQIHKSGDDVRVFSRTLNEVTGAVPEIVLVARGLPAREIILDGEVIALDRASGRPHPFQVTMRRFGRRRDVEGIRGELPLTAFLFDCLYADGSILIDESLERRVELLHELAALHAVPRIVRPTRDQAAAFSAEALARGHEGLMAKDLGSPYAAGRRGAAWLKVKRPRTLDLVVLAAEWGNGRRVGWLSNLHLGARDPETNGFVMLGKTFKGMTDAMLAWQTEKLLALEIGRDRHVVHVRPELVVEIAFNEIQESPVYPGGLALRFARVKRYREDKTAADADTFGSVKRLHR